METQAKTNDMRQMSARMHMLAANADSPFYRGKLHAAADALTIEADSIEARMATAGVYSHGAR
jgi:hypothetical protein